VESARCNEQNMIGFDHAVLGVNGATFDQWQQIALHAFAGHVCTTGLSAAGYFVDFIEEHNAGLLDRKQSALL